MTSCDDPRPEQAAQPAEAPQEAQRHIPSIITEAVHQLGDGSLKAAAGYGVKRVLDKAFGGHGQDKDGGNPEPPGDQPPAQAK